MLIEQLIEQAKNQWLNIGSLVFLVFVIIFRIWSRHKALASIKKRFSIDEYIIYEPKFPFIAEFFAPILLGGMFLEFFLSYNYMSIISNLTMFILLFLIFCVFLSSCIKYVITNKKIYVASTFDVIYKLGKLLKLIDINFFELNLSDIDTISTKASHGQLALEIKIKNFEKTQKMFVDDVSKIQSILNNQIMLLI